MFFQSPRPFGQHSTSYRSMNSNNSTGSNNGNIRSSTSMTNLQTATLESGRLSAPPADFASVYENNRFIKSSSSSTTTTGIQSSVPFNEINLKKTDGAIIFKRKQLIEEHQNDNNNNFSTTATIGQPKTITNRRFYQIHKTTSQNDTRINSEDKIFEQNLKLTSQSSEGPILATNTTITSQVPVRFVQNQQQQPTSRVRQIQLSLSSSSSSEPSRQLEPPVQSTNNQYYVDYQGKKTISQTNRFRSNSAIPFNDYIQSQPSSVPIYATGSSSNIRRDQDSGNFLNPTPISHTSGAAATANASATITTAPATIAQTSFSEQQKPMVYQQLEKRKNYATLHHVASPKMGPLQRRTSDPNLLKIDDLKNKSPETIAMFNVAKGVRAELEQDPKFRKKADALSNLNDRNTANTPDTIVPSSLSISTTPNKEHPKQSPSLRHMENFFDNVQQFRTALGTGTTKEAPPIPSSLLSSPTVSSPKPFNVEHVRSIFRTNSNSTSKQSSATSSATVEGNQNKSIQSSAVLQQTREDFTKSNEGRQNFRTTNDSSKNVEKAILSEQNLQSKSEISEQNIPVTVFVTGKPKPVKIIEKPMESNEDSKNSGSLINIPQDITVLEKDYNLTTSVVQRRLNQPFPVDDETIIESNNQKQSMQYSSTPQGILLKNGNNRLINDSLAKTQKRVVFHCDTDANTITEPISKTELDKTSADVPQSVIQYDDAIDGPFQRFLKLSADIGGDLQVVGNKLSAVFNEQRNFIWSAAGQKEPSTNEVQAKLGPVIKLIEDLSAFKESKRNTPLFNHISAASEGVQALGWLTVKPTPAPYIKDMLEAAMFFTNRVMKEHKDEKVHVDWAKSWTDVLNALQKYVRQVHTTGLVWNSNPNAKPPVSSKQTTNATTPSTAQSAGGAPPPPPPPPVLPPDLFAAVSSGADGSDKTNADRAALFAEINAGEEITKRLKKVTPDMQTHKNPALRTQEPVPGAIPKAGAIAGGGSGNATPTKKHEDKPPKTWLENGKQWNVEYHKNDKNVIVQIGDMKQTVYVYKCENSVIQVKGKVNSITLDSCKKTSIVFDSLLSQIEVINCQSVQIQTLGAMPTLSIQKTDGCQVYLSKDSMNAEIITSKSSEMNVLIPSSEDGDFVEFPVPEQFKTVYDGKKLQTTVSDIC